MSAGLRRLASAKAKLAGLLGWSKTPILPTIIVVIVLAFIPLVWRNDYIISLLVLMLLFSIMTQSWNLTIGMCGIWNFGQLAIIAIGGYATGLLTIKLGMSAWLALPAGVVAGGLAAVIMVLPSIRLRGIYASMLTFAFAEVVRLLIIADSTGFTGGPFGLTGVKGLFDSLSPSWSLRAYFWLTLVLYAAVMLLIHRMMNSPFGMGLVEPPGVDPLLHRHGHQPARAVHHRPRSSRASSPGSPAACTRPSTTASRRASWGWARWVCS